MKNNSNKKGRLRRLTTGVVVLALFLYLIISAMIPNPVLVDLGEVSRGPMQVTVDEDGQTRIRERYEVSTPLAGRLQRIELDPGDPVVAGETVLAVIEPGDPSLLDARALAAAEARVKAAELTIKQTSTSLAQAKEDAVFAKRELHRFAALHAEGIAADHQYEAARLAERKADEALRSITIAQQISQFELAQAQAALIFSRPDATPDAQRFEIRAPINGKVLRLFQESSAVVPIGAKLLELGDPRDLEVRLDVLSTDAVRIEPGQRVILDHWGGPHPLEARIRHVEPSAFTKISALGVEEQRVFVIADLIDPPDRRPTLGDAYRVEARVIVWEAEQALRVPAGALFRRGPDWAVFEVVEGLARPRTVEIGENNGLEAETLSGLEAGATVILHPTDQIADGVKIQRR